MTRRVVPALLALGSATAAACLGPAKAEAPGTTAASIIGGSADDTDVAVVALVQASTGTLCSGTLVAPTVVLTAAHCVYRVAPGDLQVLVGPDTSSPTQTLAVAGVVAYPTYTDEDTGLAGGVDLGAVLLAEPVAGITPVAALTLPTDYSAAEVTLVGYGLDSTTSGTGAGIRRSVTLPVAKACSRVVTAGGLDANACFGDSGGAVLLGGALVAVISSGAADCVTPSLQTRLDAHADWVAAVLSGDAGAPCLACIAPDPSCGAATETHAATTEDAGIDAAAVGGASTGATGGCSVGAARGLPESGLGLGALGIAGFLARRRRLRAWGSAARCSERRADRTSRAGRR